MELTLSKILAKYRIPINYLLTMYEGKDMSEVVDLILTYLFQEEPEGMESLEGNVDWYEILSFLDLKR